MPLSPQRPTTADDPPRSDEQRAVSPPRDGNPRLPPIHGVENAARGLDELDEQRSREPLSVAAPPSLAPTGARPEGPAVIAGAPLSDEEFHAVYQAEFAYVHRSLRRLGVRDRDLDDLCHDVFVAFFRGRDGYDRARPVRPWLFGIAFRVASDDRRRARHRVEVLGEHREAAADEPRTDDRLVAEEQRRRVLLALDELSIDRRAVLVMHDLDGLSAPQIAEALSAPLNTVYSRLRLAREQFALVIRRLTARQEGPHADRR